LNKESQFNKELSIRRNNIKGYKEDLILPKLENLQSQPDDQSDDQVKSYGEPEDMGVGDLQIENENNKRLNVYADEEECDVFG
jgi:hypothetical protein